MSKRKILIVLLLVGLIISGWSLIDGIKERRVETVSASLENSTREELYDMFFPFMPPEGKDFREFNWGVTKEEILEKETAERVKTERKNTLRFKTTYLDNTYIIDYLFNDEEKLYMSRYTYFEEKEFPDMLKDFSALRSTLQGRFGEPTIEYIDNPYEIDLEDMEITEKAFKDRHVKFNVMYHLDNVYIHLFLQMHEEIDVIEFDLRFYEPFM